MSEDEILKYKKAVILTEYLEKNYKNILDFYKINFQKSYTKKCPKNIHFNLDFMINKEIKFLEYFSGDESNIEYLKPIFLKMIKDFKVEVNVEFINEYIKIRNIKKNNINKSIEKFSNWELYNYFDRNKGTYCEVKILEDINLFDIKLSNSGNQIFSNKAIIYMDDNLLKIKKKNSEIMYDVVFRKNKYKSTFFPRENIKFTNKRFIQNYYSTNYRPDIDINHINSNKNSKNIIPEDELLGFYCGTNINRSIEQQVHFDYTVISASSLERDKFILGIEKSIPMLLKCNNRVIYGKKQNNLIIGSDKYFFENRVKFLNEKLNINLKIKDEVIDTKKQRYLINNINFNVALIINEIVDKFVENRNNKEYKLDVLMNEVDLKYENREINLISEKDGELIIDNLVYDYSVEKDKININFHIREMKYIKNIKKKLFFDHGLISNVMLEKVLLNFKDNNKNNELIEENIMEMKLIHSYYEVKKYLSYKYLMINYKFFNLLEAIVYSYYESFREILETDYYSLEINYKLINKIVTFSKGENGKINVSYKDVTHLSKNKNIVFRIIESDENKIVIKKKDDIYIYNINDSELENFIQLCGFNFEKIIKLSDKIEEKEKYNRYLELKNDVIEIFMSNENIISQIMIGINGISNDYKNFIWE